MYGAKPNFLCFVTDQQRADHIHCSGNTDIHTPNIDWIAEEGIRFTNSFVSNPICMPNRATLFTGLCPQAHGLTESGAALSPICLTLAEMLRRNGYETASFGKLHLAPFGLSPKKASHDWELYESRSYWEEHDDIPTPYYGFEKVYMVGGHGHFAFGNYKNELDLMHPGAYQKLMPENASAPLSGARESWKSSIPEELHYNTFIADRTIEFISRRDTYPPFFIWCSFPDPHHPYCPPKPYCDLYDCHSISFDPVKREGELGDLPWYFQKAYRGEQRVVGLKGDLRGVREEHYREILAHTYGMISMVDHNMGRVLEAVRRRGQLENTVIVFLSDHGDLMGDHWLLNKGQFFFQGLLKVPTIWRLPGQKSISGASQAFISSVDFCPTMLDLAGIPIPAGMQGKSYRSILAGEKSELSKSIYIEFDDNFVDERVRYLRTEDWAIAFFAGKPYGILFDLKRDPDELYNLWEKREFREQKSVLLLNLLDYVCSAGGWADRRCNG
jgi:arylsulfatase A-like enzyme